MLAGNAPIGQQDAVVGVALRWDVCDGLLVRSYTHSEVPKPQRSAEASIRGAARTH